MIELDDWIAANDLTTKPWLILGKGPTFSHVNDVELGDYHTYALNHVAAELEVDVAHAIDIEVVEAIGDALLTNCRWLLMPRVPHVQHFASVLRLADFVRHNRVLRELDQQGRLVVYDSATSPDRPRTEAIDVRYFSSEAAVDILGRAGARIIRSLGVDGGRSYSPTFSSLATSTLLANRQPSFDLQFERIAEIAQRHGLDYEPMIEPIRIYIGLDDTQIVAAQVLEHSIRKHASRPLQITHMLNRPVPLPKDERNRPRTGFSFSRFLIPSLCGYRGWAIYLDADMQVFADIAELWEQRSDTASLLCTNQPEPPEHWADNPAFHPGPQMSVMLLNCERLRWDIDDVVNDLDRGRYDYEALMFDMCIVPEGELDASLPATWNHLERHEPGVTRLTHYTIIETQPWASDRNPLEEVWISGFLEAVEEGAVAIDDVRRGVGRGHLKSSLLDLLPSGDPRPVDLPAAVLEVAALRQRLDDLEGGLARRLRIRSAVWHRRVLYAWELLSTSARRQRNARASLTRRLLRRAPGTPNEEVERCGTPTTGMR